MKRLHKSMMKDIRDCINPNTGYIVILGGVTQLSMEMDLKCNNRDKFIDVLEKTLKHLKTNGKEGFNQDEKSI